MSTLETHRQLLMTAYGGKSVMHKESGRAGRIVDVIQGDFGRRSQPALFVVEWAAGVRETVYAKDIEIIDQR